MQIRAQVLGPDGPESVESYRGLGNAYTEKKEYPLALEYFEKALNGGCRRAEGEHQVEIGRSSRNILWRQALR